MDVVVRTATVDDLPAVMSLERAGFEPGIVEDDDVFARRIRAFPEGFLLAGDPAWGYFCGEIWDAFDVSQTARFDLGHDIGSWHNPHGSILYVASMTVDPGRRGSGQGALLFRAGLETLLRRFDNLRQGVLIVNEHWHPARKIYRQAGFQDRGRLEGFFRPTTGPVGDALVLFHPALADAFRAT